MATWSLQNLFLQKYILLILQDISSNLHIPQFSLYSVISSPRNQQRGSTDRGTWLNINIFYVFGNFGGKNSLYSDGYCKEPKNICLLKERNLCELSLKNLK